MNGEEPMGCPVDRIAAALVCPSCRVPLDASYGCAACGTGGHRTGNQLRFAGFGDAELRDDPLNRIKETVKRRFGPAYPLVIQLLSPVLLRRFIRPFLMSFDLDRDLVADLGSGTNRYDPRLLCVDGGAYANVDIVGDLRTLPIDDGALAGIVSIAVLEHVPDPQAHVREMWRVLRPGGRVLCYVPFMQPFHASPYDYQRYTEAGMKTLFSRFDVMHVRIGAGPTSAMLWTFQEWLALLLSFGSRRLYRVLAPLMWLLSPIKFLDVLLARHPNATVAASGFVIEAQKPAEARPE
ncbi:class I SAM-dependent methyltransferase [Streptosporangium sp. NPDC001681]|uniref:class I SAM-dependent methyltransferase n=1 Tax=Streptosporangium sp. NPDC001681 TaxID=3154395 RepID=UPI00331A2D6D